MQHDAAKAAAREAATERNSEFLRWKVFERAGVRAKLFVLLLMDWAREGCEVHGKRFTVTDVEEAIRTSRVFQEADSKVGGWVDRHFKIQINRSGRMVVLGKGPTFLDGPGDFG